MLIAFKKSALAALLLLSSFLVQAQLQITPNTNAQQLAQRLVGDGITISNVTLSASPLATGYFRNVGGTQIGIDSGIVLSTGRVLTSGTSWGTNALQTNLASTSHSTAGDPQLSALINNIATNDAVVLEFDFVPIGFQVEFKYVFGSEEYPTFTCSNFNDAFAFFISGPGITGTQNMALVPGTNIPVSINSINDGTDPDLTQCNAMGPGSPFTQYFVSNTGNTNFSYNGHTTVLTAAASVQPCQTYHLKIVIADVNDRIYDSGVFLEARSLISAPLSIINDNPVSNGTPFLVEGCSNGALKIARSRKLPFPQDISLTFAGTAVNGTDIQTIPSTLVIPAGDSLVTTPLVPMADGSLEGIEQLKIYIAYSACGSLTGNYADSITINLRDELTSVNNISVTSCTANTGIIALSVPASSGAGPFQYAINGGAFQGNNIFSNLAAGNYQVTVRDSLGCTSSFVTNVGVANTLSLSVLPSDTAICAGASFVPRVTGTPGAAYTWTPSSDVSNPTSLQPTITPGTLTQQVILTATQGPCQVKDTIRVSLFAGPQVNAGPDLTIIQGDQVQLQAAAAAGSTYSWTPALALSSPTVLRPLAGPSQTTVYTLTATTPQGCTSQDATTVTVLNCMEVMNAFSPNGDGRNDRWIITNQGCYKAAHARVFNRYGALVFEDRTYSNNWDGTYKGKPLSDGTYYYVVRYELINGRVVEQKGDVTILR